MRPLSEFDPAWPHGHVQRSGLPARILGPIKSSLYAFVAAITFECGDEYALEFHKDGRIFAGRDDHRDLINAPAPKKRAKGWVNIYYIGYKFTTADLYDTPEQAREALAQREPFACIYIDVEEGEGLP